MPGRLFAGQCVRATRKKSPSFEDHNRFLLQRGGPADALPKGHLQKVGLGSPESSQFRSTANPLAKIGAARGRCLEFASVERISGGHTYPCRYQMAKVERGETVWKLKMESIS